MIVGVVFWDRPHSHRQGAKLDRAPPDPRLRLLLALTGHNSHLQPCVRPSDGLDVCGWSETIAAAPRTELREVPGIAFSSSPAREARASAGPAGAWSDNESTCDGLGFGEPGPATTRRAS